MNKKTLFIGALSALLMSVSVPCAVRAQESSIIQLNSSPELRNSAKGDLGDNLTFTLSDEGTLTVSGSGTMSSFSRYYDTPWYEHRTEIKKVVVADGITSIGNRAFQGLTELTTVVLPNSLTEIGENSFYDCSALSGIAIPDSVTSIGGSAFYNCRKLAIANLPASLTNLGKYAFYYCAIQNVTIPTGVTTIPYGAFQYCTSLKSVDIKGAVTTIDTSAFANCTSLTGINLKEGLLTIGGSAFYEDKALASISFPEGLKKIGGSAFAGCTSLTEITIPKSVTSFENYVFNGCTGIKTVHLSDGITKIYDYMFSGMSGLTTVDIPDTVTDIGYHAFDGTAITSITLSDNVTKIREYAFYNCQKLASVTLPDGLKELGSSAFYNSAITTATLPEGITQVPSSCFRDCSKLTTITFKGKIKSIGDNAFYNCKVLKEINLGTNLTTIGSYAFCGDVAITSIDLPESLATIKSNAFNGCTGLTEVTIPKTITEAQSAFYGCTNLTKLNFAEGTETIAKGICSGLKSVKSVEIPDTVKTIGDNAFKESGITEIALPNGVETIGSYAFQNMEALGKINLPDSVTTIGTYAFQNDKKASIERLPKNLKKLGSYAFYNCEGLLEAEFGNSLTEIESYAFYGCKAIKRIYIPNNVKSVGDYCFTNCVNVTNVTLGNGLTKIGNSSFKSLDQIKSITIPRNLTYAGSNSSQGPFYDCKSLKSVRFADNTRIIAPNILAGCKQVETVEIPDSVSEIGEQAFRECTGITGVKLPKNLRSIGNSAFYNVKGIEEAIFPDKMMEIGEYAFYGCSNLSKVELGKSLTSVPRYCFYGTAITEVELPYCVESIGSYAFANNNALEAVTIYGFTSKIESSAFSQTSLTIRGAAGSAAEKLADNKGYTFESLSNIKDIKLAADSLDMAVGEKTLLSATITPVDVIDVVTWSSSNESVVKVVQDSTNPGIAQIEAKGAGTAELTISAGDITRTCTVNVENIITSISISPASVSYKALGAGTKLSVSVKPNNADNKSIVWSSTDESVVTVDAEGRITTVGNGQARIVASNAKGGAKAYCYVKVAAPIPATGISLNESDITLTNSSRELSAIFTPSNTTETQINWKSSDETIATVDQNGVVKPVGAGSAVITATHAVRKFTASCKVTVKHVTVPVTGIALNERNVELNKSNVSVQLSATVLPADADVKDVIWTSSAPDIVSVDSNGLVKGVKGGNAVITAETVDGSFKAYCNVEMKSLVSEITLNKTELMMAEGSTAQLSATISPADTTDPTYRWSSSNTELATVDENGLVTALKSGITYIRCKANDNGGAIASCKLTIVDAATYQKVQKDAAIKVEQDRLNSQPLIDKPVLTQAESKDGGLIIHWQATAGADGYELNYAKDAGFANKTGLYVNGGATVTEEISGLDAGATYYIRIRAYKITNIDGKEYPYSGEWSEVISGCAGIGTPAKAAIKTVKPGKKSVTVNWKEVKGADGYEIMYSLSKNFKASKTVTVKKGSTTKKAINKLKAKKKYFVKVRAYKNVKTNGITKKVYGEWSDTKNKKTK